MMATVGERTVQGAGDLCQRRRGRGGSQVAQNISVSVSLSLSVCISVTLNVSQNSTFQREGYIYQCRRGLNV